MKVTEATLCEFIQWVPDPYYFEALGSTRRLRMPLRLRRRVIDIPLVIDRHDAADRLRGFICRDHGNGEFRDGHFIYPAKCLNLIEETA